MIEENQEKNSQEETEIMKNELRNKDLLDKHKLINDFEITHYNGQGGLKIFEDFKQYKEMENKGNKKLKEEEEGKKPEFT